VRGVRYEKSGKEGDGMGETAHRVGAVAMFTTCTAVLVGALVGGSWAVARLVVIIVEGVGAGAG